MHKLRIVIAGRDVQFRKQLKKTLNIAGHGVIGEAEDSVSALRLVHTVQPDLCIVSFDLGGAEALDLAKNIEEIRISAVILVVDYTEKDIIYKPDVEWAIPVLVKPFDELNLLTLIDYSFMAFSKVTGLQQEVNRLKSGLEVRKVVEKAKGILMKTYGLSEDVAFKRIQQQSMKKRTTMKHVAEAIIMSHEISNPR
ncbi:MAG TPA: ANTAR domain-containing protein [Desulfobacteria bacterium]|nr:ANTAR domain-containing protein [Desulfobacteria bacterium]